jgi:hypothetical protein
MYIRTYYVHTQIFKKKEHFYVPYKKDKFMYDHMTIYGHNFVFLPMPHKIFFFVKNLCGDLECPYLHVIFFYFLKNSEIIFLYIFYNMFI